jgi:hypothetical protein
VGDADEVQIDAVALEGDALRPESSALLLSHRQRAVGADDPPPGKVVGDLMGGEQAGGKARCPRRDVAIGADEPLRDRPDRVDDVLVPVGDGEVLPRAAPTGELRSPGRP